MRPRTSQLGLALGVAIALVVGAMRPAVAGPELFKHAFNTVAAGPLEFGAAPYVAADTLFHNMDSQGFSTTDKVFFTVPGFTWLLMSQIVLAAGRTLTGALELPPGFVLLATPWNVSPLLDFDREPAVYKREVATGTFLFGIYLARR